MAWVTQKFELGEMSISIEADRVRLGNRGCDLGVWEPKDQETAFGMALMLRRAARRLDEIGKAFNPVQPWDDPNRSEADRQAWRDSKPKALVTKGR